MFLIAIPAFILGSLFGRIWASLYNLEGPRRQPGVTLLGFLLVLVLTAFTISLARLLIHDFAPDRWYWPLAYRSLPFLYGPLIPAVSWLASLMYRKKNEARHRVYLAKLQAARVTHNKLDIQDTPPSQGAGHL